MASRIELELTSDRGDGTWTWRAAGAKHPKGVLDASLLPDSASVGDVLRAETEIGMDGIDVISVTAPKGRKARPETLEILGPPRSEQLVTTQLAPKGRGGRGGGRGRGGDRGDRGDRGGRGRGGDRGGDRGDRRGGGGGGGRNRAPRLRPLRTHRNAWLDTLPAEQRLVGDQLLQGGIPAVREALDQQNADAKAAGNPEIKPDALMGLAEALVADMRIAEWHDRADAALGAINDTDLRDLRSVVAGAEAGARTDETRAKADELRSKVAERIDKEHTAWLTELKSALRDGRVVRALRQSARPVKAGSPLPSDVATQLIEAAAGALAEDDVDPDRWGTVLDAVAHSPVHGLVKPDTVPDADDDDLKRQVSRLANKVPQIAAMFGIEVTPAARGSRPKPKKSAAKKDSPAKDAASNDAASNDAPSNDAPAAAAPAPEAPAADEAPAAAEVTLEEGESIITAEPEIDEPPAATDAASSEEE